MCAAAWDLMAAVRKDERRTLMQQQKVVKKISLLSIPIRGPFLHPMITYMYIQYPPQYILSRGVPLFFPAPPSLHPFLCECRSLFDDTSSSSSSVCVFLFHAKCPPVCFYGLIRHKAFISNLERLLSSAPHTSKNLFLNLIALSFVFNISIAPLPSFTVFASSSTSSPFASSFK